VDILGAVDKEGYCRFYDADHQPQSYYDYDHQARCWDEARYLLRGPDTLPPLLTGQDTLRGTDTNRRDFRAIVTLTADGRKQDESIIHIRGQQTAVRFCWDYPIFYLSGGRKEFPIGDATSLHNWLTLDNNKYNLRYNQPTETDANGLAKMASAGLPEGTVLVLADDHTGIIGKDGKVWHFLQCLENIKQGRWFNRDQVRKMEAYARKGHSPVNFWEAGVYIDALPDFLKRSFAHRNKSWPKIKVYLPK
jgi:hypothetical protein